MGLVLYGHATVSARTGDVEAGSDREPARSHAAGAHETITNMSTETTEALAARVLAPEDVEAGQYVCIFRVLREHLPFNILLGEAWQGDPVPVTTAWLPPRGGTPLRVVEVCLPFVLTQRVNGTHCTLDLRRHKLALLSNRFGSRAFKRLRKASTES